jgi:hypothetical protein
MRQRAGRKLRALAHRIDPQPPAGTRPDMPCFDFTKGEVWLNGRRTPQSTAYRMELR